MVYKIIIPVIAIVAVLFTSGFALDAFADHNNPDNRNKSAYLFKIAGNGGDTTWGGDLHTFVQNNNGVVHNSWYNWINAGGAGIGAGTGGRGGGCGDEENGGLHPPFAKIGNPRGWTSNVHQYFGLLHNSEFNVPRLPEVNTQSKLLLFGYSFGGGAAAMIATDPRNSDVRFDLVYTQDPVGPNGNRYNAIANVGWEHSFNPCFGGGFDGSTVHNVPCLIPQEVTTLVTYKICQSNWENLGDKTFEEKWRVFGSNVNYLVNRVQTGWIPPADVTETINFFKTQIVGVNDQANISSQTVIDDPNTNCLTLGGTLLEILKGNFGAVACGHAYMGSNDVTTYGHVKNVMKAMNNPPTLHDFTQVIIDEGTETPVAIRASDPLSGNEVLSSVKRTLICPAGSTFDPNSEKCSGSAKCPGGMAWAGVSDFCFVNPNCEDGFFWNSVLKKCDNGFFGFKDRGSCPVPGSEFRSEAHGAFFNQCWAPVICPSGLSRVGSEFRCEGPPQIHTTFKEFLPKLKFNGTEADPNGTLELRDISEGAKTECIQSGNLHIHPTACTAHNIVIQDGSLTVFADDNTDVAEKLLIQVEDNGFPCDNCTDDGDGQAAAMGSLGKWDREELEIIVLNVAPTVNGFGSFLGNDLRLFVHTTDPSNADTQAGFNYTINWGDDSPIQNISGNIPGNTTDVFNHFYQPGQYTVKVNATDKDDGTSDEITLDVTTPFFKLLDDIANLENDGTIKKGLAKAFTSQINAILGALERENFTPACKISDAIIIEINAHAKTGKIPQAIADDLIATIEYEQDPLGCNGGVIDVVKQTIPDGHTDQFTFTGDVSGTIGDDEQIRLGNLASGTYSTTETVSSGQTLANIFCLVNDYTEDLPTQTVSINLEENEYAVCVFFNIIDEAIVESFTGRGSVSTSSDTAISDIRLHTVTGSSNPSSPQTSDDITDDKKGGGGDEHLTRPTFGISHETFETIVDSGFRFNDQSFTINDNFHTAFIGEVNSFEAKIYADKRLKVQEFLFGIPNVGEAHLAELGVEVWYD